MTTPDRDAEVQRLADVEREIADVLHTIKRHETDLARLRRDSIEAPRLRYSVQTLLCQLEALVRQREDVIRRLRAIGGAP